MTAIYGELVRRYRIDAGLTQEELAALSGLDVRTISDIERGRTARPRRSTVDFIAQALDRDDLAYDALRTRRLSQVKALGYQPGTTDSGADRASAPIQANRPPLIPAGPAAGVPPRVDVFPVAIAHYADADLADLDTEARIGRLVDLLAPFGGQHRPWRHPARDRGADAVQRRLREWPGRPGLAADAGEAGYGAPSPSAESSVLYWAGHGWSDGTRTALAHAESPAVVGASGLEPQQLAQAIRLRQGVVEPRGDARAADGWVVVVVEVSHATAIADAIMAALHGPDGPERLLLVAVQGDDLGSAGRFTGVLASLLAGIYRDERVILLRDLAAQLERMLGPRNVHQRALGEAALVRTDSPAASKTSAPARAIRHLEDVLNDLSRDERGHFVVKAQGAEHGEMSWFFEGREKELGQISTWLSQASSGMLVVTGRAGSGKSALLGTVLVRSLPDLRDALGRRGLVATRRPDPAAFLERVFDAVIHLSGLNLAQATARTAAAAGIGPLPSRRDSEASVAGDLDFLADELASRAGPFTVLADALDESMDPLDIAGSLLARIAALPGVRVLVGTRASTSEVPDTPAGDRNLLDALGAGSCVIWVGKDREAIHRYVSGRLRAARDYGVAGRAIPHMSEVSDQDIARVAGEVARGEQEFLFARLVVYELIADPRLLTRGLARSRSQLLRGTHQQLFGCALHRLAAHDDRYPVLIRALSLARGRGLPEADGIWATVAAALDSGQDFKQAADWTQAIGGLLSRAAAYITADSPDSRAGLAGSGTVYRLAHQTFAAYFGKHLPSPQEGNDPRKLAARALLHAVHTAGPGRIPEYLVNHLSGHVAEAGLWDDLACLSHVLDRIDPHAVTADAVRTLFGRRLVPPSVAGIIGARDTLAGANPADRRGLRQLATTIHSPRQIITEPVQGWGIASARAGSSTLHLTLTGHTSTVNMVLCLTLPGRPVVLASCGDDGTIRLWDPVTATPIGVPMKGHTSTVDDICVLPVRGGRTLLAGAGEDGTVRLWDPVSGLPTGPVIAGHAGPVWSICAVPGGEPGHSPALATAGSDGTVRLWDPVSGLPAGPVITVPVPVLDLCVLPAARPGGPPVLVSSDEDGAVRLWDPVTGLPAGPVITGHAGPVLSVCVLPGGDPGHATVLASAGLDGTVRLWDPVSGLPTGPAMTGHSGPVWSMCVLPGAGPGGAPVLISAGEDGTVRRWDPARGLPAGPVIAGHVGGLLGVCVVPGGEPGQPSVLASAGFDGKVRLWDPACGSSADQVATAGHAGTVLDVCVVPGEEPGRVPTLASAGEDGTVRRWDPACGRPAGPVITGHSGAVLGLCVVPGGGPGLPALLASAGRDGTVRLWDPVSGAPAGPVITGHAGPVRGICVLPSGEPGQRPALASAGSDGTVRLWDPVSGLPAGPVITAGHAGGVLGLCAVPGGKRGELAVLASAGLDGTVRLWDPASGLPASPVMTGHAGPVWSMCVLPGAGPGRAPRPGQRRRGRDGAVVGPGLRATGRPGHDRARGRRVRCVRGARRRARAALGSR